MQNLKNKAINFFNKQEYIKSLEIFLLILKNNPKLTDVCLYVANCYIRLNDHKSALIYLNKENVLNKNLPEVFYNIGICHITLLKYDDAIYNFNKAISLKKSFFEAYIQLGQLFKNLNRLNEAINILNSALTNVDHKDAIYINLSEIYFLKKDFGNSTKNAKAALDLNPKNYFANINIANCLIELGKLEEGIVELEKAKNLNPQQSIIYNNLGYGYKLLGDEARAIDNYKKAISLNPNSHDSYFNLSHIQLAQNNFKDGWANYEHRWGTKKFSNKPQFNKPLWNKTLGFERILIWGEQGIGEQILFSTILPDVTCRFKKTILYVNDKLVALFKSKYNNVEVYPFSSKINEDIFDYHIPIGSLAKLFRQDESSFRLPLGKSDSNLKKNTDTKKFKCAISWISSNENLGNIKSVKLEFLKEILFINQIEFFNVQYTKEDKEIEEFEKKYNVEIHKNKNLDTYNDLYGLSIFLSTCDFVITVSNTNAHLAASIGIPTFLLLPKSKGKFWYWENEKNKINLWYPSIVKFKQELKSDWSKPIDDLKSYLFKKYL